MGLRPKRCFGGVALPRDRVVAEAVRWRPSSGDGATVEQELDPTALALLR
ncbi:MAG TPA: hypothetical protein VMZ06_17595 [Candidatus Bathyarchaeia archaeon]|nr:hypothetical protein [Candidatus Bathyarchaeia archaeon]